jgi:hypothetical protein
MGKSRGSSKDHQDSLTTDKKASHAGQGEEDACRCEEMSKKTPRELLKVMVGDLSFWKKKK